MTTDTVGRAAVRLQRIALSVLFVAAATIAGALGVLLAPVLDRIVITGIAIALLFVLARVLVDFFRSPD